MNTTLPCWISIVTVSTAQADCKQNRNRNVEYHSKCYLHLCSIGADTEVQTHEQLSEVSIHHLQRSVSSVKVKNNILEM